MYADKDLNNKISEEVVIEINTAIEEIKQHLDNENIVY